MASGKLSLFSKDYFLNFLLQIPESFFDLCYGIYFVLHSRQKLTFLKKGIYYKDGSKRHLLQYIRKKSMVREIFSAEATKNGQKEARVQL